MSDKTPDEILKAQIDNAYNQVEVGAKYLHPKSGNYYKVIDLAFFSEDTNQILVVYKALYGEELIFARPIEMWNELVEVDNEKTPRFVKIN